MYNGLKEQKKNLMSPIQKELGFERPTRPHSTYRSVKLIITDEAGPCSPKRQGKTPKSYISPRKRLALQTTQLYNQKKTLKDLLNQSQIVDQKSTSAFRSNPTSPKASRIDRKSIYQKKLKERNEQKIAQAKIDEENAVKAIEREAEEKFNKTIDLYNKYYTGYVFEPENRFNTKEHLKIKTDLFICPKFGAVDGISSAKAFRELKSQSSWGSNRIKGLDNSDYISTENSPKNKSPLSTPDEIKSNKVQIVDVGKRLEVENVFIHGMEDVKETYENLQRVQNLLEVSKDLSQEEELFMTHIKNGKVNSVDVLLKRDPDLVLIKDKVMIPLEQNSIYF